MTRPGIRPNTRGSILNLTSIGGIQAGGGVQTYRASKAAVIQFTKSAAIELAYYDIRVNAMHPATSRTAYRLEVGQCEVQ